MVGCLASHAHTYHITGGGLTTCPVGIAHTPCTPLSTPMTLFSINFICSSLHNGNFQMEVTVNNSYFHYCKNYSGENYLFRGSMVHHGVATPCQWFNQSTFFPKYFESVQQLFNFLIPPLVHQWSRQNYIFAMCTAFI